MKISLNSHPKSIALLSILLLFLPLLHPVEGKVFRMFGGGGGKDTFAYGRLPWDHAYQTEMTVDGRRSILKVYSARHNEPVVKQLKSRFEELGAKVQVQRSDNGVAGRAVWPDKTMTFMVLSPPAEPQQQIFIYEPIDDGKSSKQKLPVPIFGQAEVYKIISDNETRTHLVTLKSTASATDAHVFYAKALQGAGWTVMAPALVKDGAVRGMAVYEKKNSVCYVQATDRVGGPNMITLLVKGGTL